MVENIAKRLSREGATPATRNGDEDSIRLIECTRGNKRVLVVADIPSGDEWRLAPVFPEGKHKAKAAKGFVVSRGGLWGQAPNREQGSNSPKANAGLGRGTPVALTQEENIAQWKRAFYRAYEQEQFDRAEAIYRNRLAFDFDTPDVHAAFRQQRRDDLLVRLLTSGLLAVALLLAWLLLG